MPLTDLTVAHPSRKTSNSTAGLSDPARTYLQAMHRTLVMQLTAVLLHPI